jgi:hypothetical protein
MHVSVVEVVYRTASCSAEVKIGLGVGLKAPTIMRVVPQRYAVVLEIRKHTQKKLPRYKQRTQSRRESSAPLGRHPHDFSVSEIYTKCWFGTADALHRKVLKIVESDQSLATAASSFNWCSCLIFID